MVKAILNKIGVTAVVLLCAILLLAVGYGSWKVKRWYNYNYGYGSQVEDTIKTMVKKECLNG